MRCSMQEKKMYKRIKKKNIQSPLHLFFIETLISYDYIINTGTKSYDISISIKNNCNLQYPKGVKLVLNEKESYLYPNEKIINIKPLKPNESQEIKLTFSNLKHLSAEAYSTFLSFLINDEIFDFIEIKFKLKQKRNK